MKITEDELKVCEIQAELFAQSLKKVECSSSVFIRQFMNSQIAQRMDNGGFLFEACDIENIFTELEEEYGKFSYGKEKFSEDEIFWIGYIYRYWVCVLEKTSRQVYKCIKPTELRLLYYPYHSLDPEQAIERILEAKGKLLQNTEVEITERGVKILRKLLAQV